MTSLLKSFKQVPVNAGYFVCIKTDASGLIGVNSTSGNPDTASVATATLGNQYMDLGVTRRTGSKVYRKVVIVTSPLNVLGDEKFIEIGGAASSFARMG
jgi:hypothetical protein